MFVGGLGCSGDDAASGVSVVVSSLLLALGSSSEFNEITDFGLF